MRRSRSYKIHSPTRWSLNFSILWLTISSLRIYKRKWGDCPNNSFFYNTRGGKNSFLTTQFQKVKHGIRMDLFITIFLPNFRLLKLIPGVQIYLVEFPISATLQLFLKFHGGHLWLISQWLTYMLLRPSFSSKIFESSKTFQGP